MEESWVSNGKRCSRNNRINVEVIGRDARRIMESARVGMWATIEGYIRSEEYQGRTLTKMRTLNIEVWEHGRVPGQDPVENGSAHKTGNG